jgi:hypothetical protein|tara:strand:+ start:307 stop:633 length:327 start_codon:yes stop_codon:yes gene_type:complete
MAVTWSVASLDATKTVGSLSDVVTTVHWTATDSETVGSDTYTGSSYGSVGLAEADSSSFTAYASISESDAITWAKAAIGADQVTAIETGIAAQITEAKTPTKTSGVPW